MGEDKSFSPLVPTGDRQLPKRQPMGLFGRFSRRYASWVANDRVPLTRLPYMKEKQI